MLSVSIERFDFALLIAISAWNLKDISEREHLITVIQDGSCSFYEGEWTADAIACQLRQPGTSLFFLYAASDLNGLLIAADGRQKHTPILSHADQSTAEQSKAEPSGDDAWDLEWADAVGLEFELADEMLDEQLDGASGDPLDNPRLHHLNDLDCDLEVIGYHFRLGDGRLLIEPASLFLGMNHDLCPSLGPLSPADERDHCLAMRQFIQCFVQPENPLDPSMN